MATDLKCTLCGESPLEEGFMSDTKGGAKVQALWVEGPVERGPLGGPRLMGKTKRSVIAYRCPQCGHLELFAN